jgi:SAM-dependent methyltransferase
MFLEKIYKKRTICRLCDASNLTKVVDLEPIPLSENYFADKSKSKSARKFPIDLYMCDVCGHVQHVDIINPDVLWDGYTYFSAESSGMVEHFNETAQFVIEKVSPEMGSLIVDIGSNDGSFLRAFKKRGFEVCGVDPAGQAAKRANDNRISTLVDFFDDKSAKTVADQFGQASIITAFNVFAHADNLLEMVNAAKLLLADDGVFVFEAQYLADIIKKNLVATIFHEHISHHSIIPLQKFFDRVGMELIFVKHDDKIQHGSIIGGAQIKGQMRQIDKSVDDFVEFEKEMHLDTLHPIQEFGRSLNKQKLIVKKFVLAAQSCGKSFAGFGAARSAPTLISQFALGQCIDFIVDDAATKLGKYSPGDGIIVKGSDYLYQDMPNYTFILAWVHAFRIIENHREYLASGGCFILLSPNVKLIDQNGLSDLAS